MEDVMRAHVDPATAFVLAGVVGGSVTSYLWLSGVAVWRRWRGLPVEVVLDGRDTALLVVAQTPHIRQYLTDNDPMALAQVDEAIRPVVGEPEDNVASFVIEADTR